MCKPSAHKGLSPYLQLKELKSLLSPSLANHWGDLHMLLDAVPGFPSGIVNPLPLLHGQRELLNPAGEAHRCSYRGSQKAVRKFPHGFVTYYKAATFLHLLQCYPVTMHKDKTNMSTAILFVLGPRTLDQWVEFELSALGIPWHQV